ncbi:MAG: hypothetical protein AMXMBFR48_17340 [Ignavibacteriales bacterium]
MGRINKSFSDSFYVLLSNIIEKVVFFLLFAVIARSFEKEVYGFVVSAFALGNIAGSFFDFGFVFYFQREAAAGSREFYSRLYSAVVFRLLSWLPFTIIVTGYGFSLNGSLVSLLLITTSAFLFGINNDLSAVLFGRKEYKKSVIFLAKARTILLIIFTGVYLFSENADLLVSSFLISAAAHFLFLASYFRKSTAVSGKFSFGDAKRMILLALPMSLGFIANWVYDKIDVLVIGEVLDLESVAVYATAYSVYKLPQSLGNSIVNPLYSAFSSDFAKDGRINFRMYKRQIYLLLFFSVVMAGAFFFLSEMIITVIYSVKYISAGGVLSILALGVPFLLLNNVTGIALNAMRRDIHVTTVVILAGLLNIGINLHFLPVLGIIGAVYATIFTEGLILLLQAIIIFWVIRKNS